jgi:hypothetical protein
MPACLNPSLFGIIRQRPDENQRRTLLLISKGLQGVSNMSGYGGKEKWILPMGTLSAEYEDRFTAFIDQICDTSGIIGSRHPAQYSGPALVKSRLDPLSQEGIPALPFLIDEPREFAGVVKLWNRHLSPPLSPTAVNHHFVDPSRLSDVARDFHSACAQITTKMTNLIETAVEREEEDFSENDNGEEELASGIAEMSIHNSQPGSSRLFRKELYRKRSFSLEEEYSSSPPKRGLDAVWRGFLGKRPSERDRPQEL